MDHMVNTSANFMVAIASSTGGPKALQQVLGELPKDFSAPIVVVQHMQPGFTGVMAQRLGEICPLPVKEGEDGEELKGGTVYIAKSGLHLQIQKKAAGKHILHYFDAPLREGVKPCADYLFESLAECGYETVLCVVLTGMGSDSTAGIKCLRSKKNCYVITQDENTSAVFGMPKRIKDAGLSDIELPIEQIAQEIINNAGGLKNGCKSIS